MDTDPLGGLPPSVAEAVRWLARGDSDVLLWDRGEWRVEMRGDAIRVYRTDRVVRVGADGTLTVEV